LFGAIWVSRYQEGKTNLDFSEARDIECLIIVQQIILTNACSSQLFYEPPCTPISAPRDNDDRGVVITCALHGVACRQAVEDGVRLSKDSLKELFTALSPPGTITSPRIPFSAPPDDDAGVHEAEDHRRYTSASHSFPYHLIP